MLISLTLSTTKNYLDRIKSKAALPCFSSSHAALQQWIHASWAVLVNSFYQNTTRCHNILVVPLTQAQCSPELVKLSSQLCTESWNLYSSYVRFQAEKEDKFQPYFVLVKKWSSFETTALLVLLSALRGFPLSSKTYLWPDLS